MNNLDRSEPAVAGQLVYQIIQVRPPGYAHAEVLTELAETTYFGLRRLGLTVHRDRTLLADAVPVVIGAHLLDASAARSVLPSAIIYNTEQITPDSPWLAPHYLQLLKTHQVWDYSTENLRRLAALGVNRVRCVPVGYVPELSRIAPAPEDIDVLFYGSTNARREAILQELQRRGLKVTALFGSYGEERDAVIARAKLVLSVHFFESKIFEIVRVSYLLTNFKAVVAECDHETAIEADIRDAVCGVPYSELVDACVRLVHDEPERRRLAARGYEIFASRPAAAMVAPAVGASVAGLPTETRSGAPLPRTLQLGSGKDFRPDAFNIDINPAWAPDAVVDISGDGILGLTLDTARFGSVLLHEDQFEAIIANDVLEHIPNLTGAMSNCLRLLRPGGLFHIAVPYELGVGAWQDPTHVRAFNENSWLYYTDWHWYLGWLDMRFDRVSIQFQPSTFGEQLIKAGKTTDEILRTPRAVDNMRVVLRKRYLQASERSAALQRQPGHGRERTLTRAAGQGPS